MFALIRPGSQTSRCRCGVARVLRFQDGKVRRDHVAVGVSEVVVETGLEVTVQKQRRIGEIRDRDGEMENDMRMRPKPFS